MVAVCVHSCSQLFGFEQWDAPVLESEELFVRKAGEEITDQLYNFEVWGPAAEPAAYVLYCGIVTLLQLSICANLLCSPCVMRKPRTLLLLLLFLFLLQDKGARRVALRPELTPSLARLILAKQRTLALPAKWFAIGQCWRYERMTRGRR
jgi:histidyl-tRNA synthetase